MSKSSTISSKAQYTITKYFLVYAILLFIQNVNELFITLLTSWFSEEYHIIFLHYMHEIWFLTTHGHCYIGPAYRGNANNKTVFSLED